MKCFYCLSVLFFFSLSVAASGMFDDGVYVYFIEPMKHSIVSTNVLPFM